MYNAVRSWYPRFADQMEFEDLVNEAWCVFLKCQRRYAGVVDNPKWFMAIFVISLRRRFYSLLGHNPAYISYEEVTAEHDEPGTEGDAGYAWRVLKELPADMQELLSVLALGDDRVIPTLWRRLRELAAGEGVRLPLLRSTTEEGV